ncbi:MAG: glycosyltransferase [Deltaproteobacteria bacterium]
MDITIAVVTYNAAGCIKQCIESVLQQEYKNGLYELLVVDGCSNDGTQEIVKDYGSRVRMVENAERTIASNRNVALREAKYPYIAFTDSDCVVQSNWLEKLSINFEELLSQNNQIAGVGGGNIVGSGLSAFHEALSVAQNSFIGSLGSVQGTLYENVRAVDSLGCLNVLYNRDLLLSIGGFDEDLKNMCEDTDINYRLRDNGYLLYYIPDATVIHNTRQNLSAWCNNMFEYGKGRAIIMLKHKTLFSRVFILPVMFCPILLTCFLFGFRWHFLWLAILYFPSVFVAGLILALKAGQHRLWFSTGLVLCCTHIGYAAGLWAGFVIGYDKRKSLHLT